MPEQNFNIVMRVLGGQVVGAELEKTAAQTDEVGAAQEEAGAKAKASSGSFLKQAVAIAAVYKAYQFLKGSVDTTESLAKSTLALQRATGLDVKQSQNWIVATQQRGITTKNLQMAMATLATNIDTVHSASTKTVTALQTLGLSQKALKDAGPEQRMNLLAAAFSKLPNGIQKARAAQQLFGRSGQALLPILDQGAKGMNDQLKQAQRLVPTIGKSSKAVLEDIAAQRKYKEAILGVQVAIGTALIPILTRVVNVITPITVGFAKLMRTSLAFRTAIGILVGAMTTFFVYTKLLRTSLIALGVSEEFALGPLGWIALAVGALAAAFYMAYHHITWFHNAVDAVTGFIKAHWRSVVTGMAVVLGPVGLAIVAVVTHLHTFESVARAVVGAVKAVFGGLGSYFGGFAGRVAASARTAFNGWKAAASAVVKAIIGGFNSAWNFLKGFVSFVTSIPSKIGSVFSSIKNDATSLPGKLASKFGLAEGGPVLTSGAYLVGEQGPEIVSLSRGANVVPNSAIGGAGGGMVIHTHVELDRKEIALAVGRYTSDQQKRR